MDKKTYNNLLVSNAPHIVTGMDTQKTMLMVMIALVPALVVSCIVFGLRALLLTAVSIVASMVFETLWNLLMKKQNTTRDFSAALTGMILAFNVPVSLPIWMLVVGDFIAIIIVKQLFGGIGKNITNPAITARIVLFVSFATEMTTWTNPVMVDTTSGATPLGMIGKIANYATADPDALPGLKEMFLGLTAGSLGEVSAIALLVGGLFLVWKKIISPIIPVCFIGTVFVFSLIVFLAQGNPDALYLAVWQVLAGGVMLGAIFMATDYATSPLLPWAKVVFGIGCGAMTVIIRVWGQYPEGVSFAIILMNCLTPLINNFFQKKMYGGAK